jgi:4-hydroxybenzoate polyprenyltransferase
VPVADFMISGIGAGFLPFLMGSELGNGLSSSVPFIMLGALPLMLIQCGGHIIQAVGDYEADRKTGVRTFVVRYGRKNGVIVAGSMFLIAGFSPLVYSASGLLPYKHLLLYLVLFPLSVPIIMRYSNVLKNPSTRNVICMQKTTRKYGIIGVAAILAYVLLTRIAAI